MKVVLDTNIFISILKRGRLRKILNLWLDDKFNLALSDEIIKEIFEVLKRPKFSFSIEEIEELGNLIFEKSIICNPKRRIRLCSDSKDDKFLECAIESEASFLVSGDHHLLELNEFKGVKIISPANFIALF